MAACLGLAGPAHAASFCGHDEARLRIDAVVMRGTVTEIEIRNVGPVEADLQHVEVVVLGSTNRPVHAALADGEATVRRLAFPWAVRMAVGEVVKLGMQGGFDYRRDHGEWPHFEMPVRGGEPDVPDLRVVSGWRRTATTPRAVALVCANTAQDLDFMAVSVNAGRIQAPTWEPPAPTAPRAPGSGLSEEPPPDPPDPVADEISPTEPEPYAPEPSTPEPPTPTTALKPPRYEITGGGYAAIFARAYTPDGDARTNDVSSGPEVQARLQIKGKRTEAMMQVYALADVQNGDERGIMTLQDAYVGFKAGRLRVRLGVQSLSWGALEVFQPADTLNARYFDGDLADPVRLGEPMAEARLLVAGFALHGYVMPAYIATRFPVGTSRRGFVPGITPGDPIWIDADGRESRDSFGLQGAFLVTRTIGPVDLTMHAIRQVDRVAPVFVFDLVEAAVRPVYLPVFQVGGTARAAFGPVVIKLEGARRSFTMPTVSRWGPFADQDHVALAAGFDVSADLGRMTQTFLAEGQALVGDDPKRLAQMTPFQRDVLVGYRLDFNDTQSRNALLGAIVDLEQPDRIYLIGTYKQRMFESFTAEVQGLYVHAPEGEELQPMQLEQLHNHAMLQIRVARHF